MKATLKIEAIGDNTDQYIKLWTNITNSVAPGLGDITFGKTSNYWVAKITGTDPKYKYNREFLKGKKDYTNSNSVGSRGVFVYYLLEDGYVYEVKKSVSWKNYVRYFCKVDENGDIVKIDEDEVNNWIKNHSA